MTKLSAAAGRLGTESAFEVLARAQALAAEGRDIVNLGIGQPDFPTPPHIVEAAIAALRAGHHGYTPAAGLPALREAVAADLARRHDARVDPGRVMILPGAKPVMFFAALLLGEAGAEILYPDPGFPIYRSVAAFSGATPVSYPLREANLFAFDADEVLERITPATRLLIVNSPANPTGGVTSQGEISRLIRGLEQHPQVTVLSDEIYSQMLYGGRRHTSLLGWPEIADRLILLDGWSKTYAMTGWRLGFAVWPEALWEAAERLAINDHSCVNAAAQHAALAALTGPQEAVAEMVAAFDARRALVVDGLNVLPGIRCADPGGAFYAFPNISGTGMDARTAQTRFLEEAGVATVAGTSFGAEGEGFVRVSYAAGTAALDRALDRLGTLLRAAG